MPNTMTTATKQLRPLCGYQEHSDGQFKTQNITLKRKPLERLLLFDEKPDFASKSRAFSSPSTDFLPPISEAVEEFTLAPPPSGSHNATQNAKVENRGSQQQWVSIPKIVIECEENVITVNPEEEVTGGNNPKPRPFRTDDGYRSFPILPRRKLDEANPRFLHLRGKDRAADSSTIDSYLLPRLPPKRTRKSHNISGGLGDAENQQKVFQEFFRYEHDKGTITPRKSKTRGQVGAVDDDDYFWRHRKFPTEASDNDPSYYNPFLASVIENGPGCGRHRNCPRSYISPSKSKTTRQESRDYMTNYFNSIAMAFVDNPNKDGFSPMSGNLTSDLRHHFSRMTHPSVQVKAATRFRDRGDIQHPDMHLFDVMTTRSKHNRKLNECSGPVPIAEGVDLSTLLPSVSEDKSNTKAKEEDHVQDSREESQILPDSEMVPSPCSDSLQEQHPWCDNTGNDLSDKSVKETHEEIIDTYHVIYPNLFFFDTEFDDSTKQPTCDDSHRQRFEESCDGDNSETFVEPGESYNTDADLDHAYDYRSEVTRKVGDMYEYSAQIHYNTPRPDGKTRGAGEQKQFSFANWILPKYKNIMTPIQSPLQLQKKTKIPQRSRKYVPNLTKTNKVSDKKVVSEYSQRKSTPEPSVKLLDRTNGKKVESPAASAKHSKPSHRVAQSKVDSGLHRHKSKSMSEVDWPEDRPHQREHREEQREIHSSGSEDMEKDPRIIAWEISENFGRTETSHTDIHLTPDSQAIVPPSKLDIKLAKRNPLHFRTNDPNESESETEEEHQFMKRIKARVLRMRKVLPPPSPTKMCFFLSSDPSHQEIINQIEACRKVKVATLQYDPVYIARCGKGGQKSMWIFEVTPESDRNSLLTSDLKLVNQSVTVRALDDVYNEEHRTFQMYHAVRMEQRAKMLNTSKRRKKKL